MVQFVLDKVCLKRYYLVETLAPFPGLVNPFSCWSISRLGDSWRGVDT